MKTVHEKHVSKVKTITITLAAAAMIAMLAAPAKVAIWIGIGWLAAWAGVLTWAIITRQE